MGWFTLWSLASEGSVWIIWWLATVFPYLFWSSPMLTQKGFPKRGRKKGAVCTKHFFFSVVLLSEDVNWLSPVRNPASSVPGDLVERRSEWGISFWSFLWKVWRWFLSYIRYSKEMLAGSWLDWTLCFIFQKPSTGEKFLSTETHDICLRKTTWLIVLCTRIRLNLIPGFKRTLWDWVSNFSTIQHIFSVFSSNTANKMLKSLHLRII